MLSFEAFTHTVEMCNKQEATTGNSYVMRLLSSFLLFSIANNYYIVVIGKRTLKPPY